MAICLQNFKGIMPRQDSSLLSPTTACVAENVKLWHGRLDPWREPLLVADLGENIVSAHVRDCCWRGSDSACTVFTDAKPCTETYISDPCECPRYIRDWCDDEPVVLGFPKPEPPVMLSQDMGEDDDAFTELRSYLITYGNECSEGAPSIPSDAIKADKEDLATIMLPQPGPDNKYPVTKIYIYRAASTWDCSTGFQSPPDNRGFPLPLEAMDQGFFSVGDSNVDCYLVGCVDVGTTVFTDGGDVLDAGVGRSITSFGFYPPPEGLIIIGETRANRLVGYEHGTNCVYFSEPNTYWAWPSKNKKTLDCKIRGGCVLNNTAFILTEGKPYLIQDDAPCEMGASGARTVNRIEETYPLCATKSVVCTVAGVTFASTNGLINISETGTVTNLSKDHFAPDDWAGINPCSIRAAEYMGSYFFTSDNFSGIFDLGLNGTGEATGNLTTICFYPECWVKNKHGDLFFVSCGKVYQWDAGTEYIPMHWRSVPVQLPYRQSMSAAQVHFSNLSKDTRTPCSSIFTVYSEDRERYTRDVPHSEHFRICVNNVCDVSMDVRGEKSVRRLCIGTGYDSLNAQVAA